MKDSFDREDGSYFLKALATFALAGLAVAAIWIAWDVHEVSRWQPEEVPYSSPSVPQQITKTYALLPGETGNLHNATYSRIEVRSEYPVRVLTGPCHADYTVDFFCPSGSSDVFIQDERSKPLFRSPSANAVTVTASR